MYPPPSSRSPFPRHASSSGDAPLTAERAMMDQIRSKLERAQRRLAHTAPSSSSSSRYIPSSEYNSAMHKPPVTSVLMEDMPATASKHYSSRAPPPSTRTRPPPSSKYTGMPPPPSSRYAGMPPPSSRYAPPPSSRRPPSSKYDSRYANQQYKSRSKYSKGEDSDPLNGGPPPMSTPYLVYSSSRPPMTGSHHSKSSRSPTEQKHKEEKVRHRVQLNGPPSAMRSGVAKPPSSRVRFEGHETELRESIEKFERDSEAERKRLHQQRKEREARHQRRREQELKNVNARAKGSGPSSPIAAATRGRRSASVEKPPNSAIKLSAYEDIAQAIPTSPVGRPRRSSISNPPPKSDIKVSAFDDLVPRRRTSAGQDNPPEPSQPADAVEDEAVATPEPAAGDTDADQERPSESDNQQPIEPPSPAVKSPPASVVPEHDNFSSSDEEDSGDTSGFESDDSYIMYSDSEAELSTGYSIFDTLAVPEHQVVYEDATDSDDSDSPTDEPNVGNQAPEPEGNNSVPSPPASELSTVKEEEDEVPQPVSRGVTARDLAFMALGRASSCSLSDLGSPVSSANGKESPRSSMVPMSYTPASSAFPPSRSLGRPPVPATTGHTRSRRVPPPSSSMSNYVPRSRTRAPMDLKNQLPPSIGVLSGLSSGSSTFVMDPSSFYQVTWKTGEFAFSVQRVYTEENEYEFDDRNQEPQLFLRMLLNTERSTCRSFHDVRLGDVLIRVGDSYVSDLGLEGSGTVLTKFFARLTGQTPIKLTFQRMYPSDWEGGVEL
uniref:Uncharacterized protein n=1 Tax=Phytophthora ramorum TaxID=164328 RepID=H3GDA8_PHYRM